MTKHLPPKDRKRTLKQRPRLRAVPLGHGLPNLTVMRAELLDMTDLLLGRHEAPIDTGVSTLMEVADSFFARASEMTMLIQEMESDGLINRGDPLYKFRTGELRTFMEMAKKAADLGSRRITYTQMRMEAERVGRSDLGPQIDG